MRLFCVVDVKSDSVCMTFSSINESTARRSFEDLIAAPERSVFSLHPEDFSLFALCEIKLGLGIPVVLPEVMRICSGTDYSSAVLSSLREQRAQAFNTLNEKEVSSDGN